MADPDLVKLANEAVSISSTNSTTGQEAILKLTLTVSVAVPEDGKVEVQLPKWLTAINEGAPADESMINDQILESCEVHADTEPTCEITSDASGDKVMILNGFQGTGGVKAGGVLNIAVKNVKNPISLKPKTGFRVTTLDANGNPINASKELTLTMNNVFAHTSIGESLVKLSGDTAPERLGSYICQFKTTLPVPKGGYITLTLPKEILLDDLSKIQIAGATHFSQSVALKKGTNTGNIVFKDAFREQYVAPGSAISFTLNYLKNPKQPESTESFAFHTFDGEGFGIEKLDAGLTVSSRVGKLKNIVFSPITSQQGVYQVSNVWDLKLTLDGAFDNEMQLVVEFDDDTEGYQPISDAACTIKSSSFKVADAYTCNVISSRKQITIANLVTSKIEPGTVIEVQLAALRVKNPASMRNSSTVYVYTANADKVIDIGTSSAFSPKPSGLLVARVRPSSLVTSEQNVEYTMTVQPSGPIPKNAVIKIVLPAEIEINDFSAIDENCGDLPATGTPLKDGKLPEFTCNVIDGGRAIKIDKLFVYGGTSYYQAVSFRIPGLQNPRLVGVPTSSFQIHVFEDEQMASQVYAKNDNVFVQMTQANPFGNINIRSESIVNKAITTYRV